MNGPIHFLAILIQIMNMINKSLVIALVVLFIETTGYAATITWIGAAGISWTTAANWDSGTVPTINDDVIIKSDSVVVRSGSLAVAKSVEVEGASVFLTIQSGAQLTVTGSLGIGMDLSQAATVVNYGVLEINDAKEISLKVFTSSRFENFDSLSIDNGSDSAIRTASGALINQASGVIDIANMNLNSVDAMNCNENTENRGRIIIKNVFGGGAMLASNSFSNNGIININNVNHNAGATFEALGDFINEIGGKVTIDNVTGMDGVYLSGNAKNIGTITVRNVGGEKNGIRTLSGAPSNLGIINIEDSVHTGAYISGDFLNAGSIFIQGATDYGIINYGNFTNDLSGIVQISSRPGSVLQSGIQNFDTLINNGNILVGDTTQIGISNTFNSIFSNAGLIEIEHSDLGLRTSPGSSMSNSNIISIDNCNSGAYLPGGQYTSVIPGQLNISNCTDGIEISMDGILTNGIGCNLSVTGIVGAPFEVSSSGVFEGLGTSDF